MSDGVGVSDGSATGSGCVNVHPRGGVTSRWTFAAIVGVNIHRGLRGERRWTFAAIVGVNVHPGGGVGPRWTFAPPRS